MPERQIRPAGQAGVRARRSAGAAVGGVTASARRGAGARRRERRRWRSRRRSCTGPSMPRAAALPARSAARASPRTRCAWRSWCRYRVAGPPRAGGGLIQPLRSVPPPAVPARGSAPSSRRGAPEPLGRAFRCCGGDRSLFLTEAPSLAAASAAALVAGAALPAVPPGRGEPLPPLPRAAGAAGAEAVQNSPFGAGGPPGGAHRGASLPSGRRGELGFPCPGKRLPLAGLGVAAGESPLDARFAYRRRKCGPKAVRRLGQPRGPQDERLGPDGLAELTNTWQA